MLKEPQPPSPTAKRIGVSVCVSTQMINEVRGAAGVTPVGTQALGGGVYDSRNETKPLINTLSLHPLNELTAG